MCILAEKDHLHYLAPTRYQHLSRRMSFHVKHSNTVEFDLSIGHEISEPLGNF